MKTISRGTLRAYAGAAALALTMLAGCGGGGGGGSEAPPVSNAPPVPSITLSGPVTTGALNADVATYTGNEVLLDAGASKDPDGDVLTYHWTLTSRPPGSTLALAGTSGAQLKLKPDVAGTYVATLLVSDPRGGSAQKQATIMVHPNAAPVVAIETVVVAKAGSSGSSTIETSVGYWVALSGDGSTDADGGKVSYAWELVSKPSGSNASLPTGSGAYRQLEPDVLGDYVVKLVTTASNGAASSYLFTVSVKNRSPRATISSNATPLALPTGPELRLPVNTELTLRGSASSDADGDALTYTWTLAAKPDGSAASLSATSGAAVQLTPDVAGSYKVWLRATDPSGAYSEQVLVIESGNAPPTAVVDKSRMSVLVGVAAKASAAPSHDDDNDTLTFAWAIDARPSGSSATIAAPGAAQLSFTPDVAGTYVASVTVSDGKSSRVGYVSIKALASTTASVALPFVPFQARYSKGIDRFVAVSNSPDVLHIVDPFTGDMRQVPLPLPTKALRLSPDGKLAAVVHEGIVSLIDLQAGTLLHSAMTGGSQTDAVVTNAGLVYLVGQTGGQWAVPTVAVVNGRTGANLTNILGRPEGWSYYGNMHAVFAPTKNKVLLMTDGLSPADIEYFTIDASSGAVIKQGDSPYHGTFPMRFPLFMSGDDTYVFTGSGTFFRTDTLEYAGRLALSSRVVSMSHSVAADEAIVLSGSDSYNYTYPYGYITIYASSYQRYTGPLFLPDAAIALPLVGGLQSYGIGIYHSANDNHVALVQTGGTMSTDTGLKHYLITR